MLVMAVIDVDGSSMMGMGWDAMGWCLHTAKEEEQSSLTSAGSVGDIGDGGILQGHDNQ